MMKSVTVTDSVRATLVEFGRGYAARDLSRLDTFMELFAARDDIEMIGVGAAERSGYEWFEGPGAIRDVIESDWTYWGTVNIDTDHAKITCVGETAWVSMTGTLTVGAEYEKAYPDYLKQMQEMLADESRSLDDRLTDATHFGVCRLRDRMRGSGAQWPVVISAVLISTDKMWRFHTLHWSFPAT